LDAQFVEDHVSVLLNRSVANLKSPDDFLTGKSPHNEVANVLLALRERDVSFPLPHAASMHRRARVSLDAEIASCQHVNRGVG